MASKMDLRARYFSSYSSTYFSTSERMTSTVFSPCAAAMRSNLAFCVYGRRTPIGSARFSDIFLGLVCAIRSALLERWTPASGCRSGSDGLGACSASIGVSVGSVSRWNGIGMESARDIHHTCLCEKRTPTPHGPTPNPQHTGRRQRWNGRSCGTGRLRFGGGVDVVEGDRQPVLFRCRDDLARDIRRGFLAPLFVVRHVALSDTDRFAEGVLR